MEIGFVGLGRMGGNMSLRLLKKGHRVIGFDLAPAAVQSYASKGTVPADDWKDFVKRFKDRPRLMWIMVPAGDPTTQAINTLIATTIDSITGYEDSAKNIDHERFREIFRERANERQRVVEDLRARRPGVVQLRGRGACGRRARAADVGGPEHTVGREVVDLRRLLEEASPRETVVAVGLHRHSHDFLAIHIEQFLPVAAPTGL